MIKNLLVLLVALLCISNSFAQKSPRLRTCAAQTLHEERLIHNKKYRENRSHIENNFRTFKNSRTSGKILDNTVRIIPIYVHVIYDEAIPESNISLAQIESQINVLNQDFQAINSDISNVPEEFSSLVADYNIEFELISVSRKASSRTEWGTSDEMKSAASGGMDPVSPENSLNIWICNIGPEAIGYAQFPGGPIATDGVVVSPQYFGSSVYGTDFYLEAPYDKGRTATHEVGHFLNLYHIWGDGGCSDDDLVEDTPASGNPNYGCPAYPTKSCSENTAYTSDMYMNYMDYVNDECMMMFTTGQKIRTESIFTVGGARENLGYISDECELAAPANLIASGISDAEITFTWDLVEGATSYEIVINGTSNVVSENTFQATSLTAGLIYNVQVRATCESGTGDFSGILTLNTTGCPVGPALLTIVTDSYGGEINWELLKDGIEVASGASYLSNSTVEELLSYGDGIYTFNISDSYGDGICCAHGEGSYSITDFTGNVIHAGGDYGAGESVQFCIEGSPEVDTESPSAPQNLVVENISKTSAELSWEASTDNIGVAGYKIYVNDVLMTTTEVLFYNLENLNEAEEYNIAVSAIDNSGNESISTVISFTTTSVCSEAESGVVGTNTVPATEASEYIYKYTMASTSQLEITSEISQEVKIVINGCTDDEQVLTSGTGAVGIQYFYEGDELFIIWDSSNGGNFEWQLTENPYDVGEVCYVAEEAVIGTNSIPSTNNMDFWYEYTMPDDGIIKIASNAGSWVQLYSGGCKLKSFEGSGNQNVQSENYRAGDVVFISFTTFYNNGNFDWELEVIPFSDGDICEMPVVATEGENQLPETSNNYYWYSFTMPINGKLQINSAASDYIQVYSNACNSLSPLNYNYGNVTVRNLSEGETVYIQFSIYNGGGYIWNLTASPPEIGDVCSDPVTAVTGVNSLPSSLNTYFWYTFTMPEDGNLAITSETSKYIQIFDECYSGISESGRGNLTAFDLKAGETFYFRWVIDGTGSFDWNLEVLEPVPGDNCGLPQDALLGLNNTSVAPRWFEFIAESTGDYTISSVGTATNDTYLRVYSDCGESSLASNDDHNSFQSQVTLPLNQGDIIKILWDDNYSSLGFNWTIKTTQSITFGEMEDKTFGDEPFELSGTSTSGLDLAYTSSNTDVAVIDGATVTILSVGTTTITATQAGSDGYLEAESVEQVLTVNKSDQAITFNSLPDKVFGDVDFDLTATSSSGLDLSYSSSDESVAVVNGNTVTIIGAGTTTITASHLGNENYNAAISVEQTLIINKADQQISYNSITDKFITDAPFSIMATSNSGLSLNYSIIEGPATIDGNTVTLTGSSGFVYLKIVQSGNGNYNPTSESLSFLVKDPAKMDQEISFEPLENLFYGDADFTLTGSSNSGLPISYTSSDESVAIITNNTVQIIGAGTTLVEAHQTGDDEYNAAHPVSQSLTIDKAELIVEANDVNIIYGNQIPELTATYDGFVNGDNEDDLIEKPILETFANNHDDAGEYDILISGGQSDNYTFNFWIGILTIAQAEQFIVVEPVAVKKTDDAPFNIEASVDSNLPLEYSIVSEPATISGSTVTLAGVPGIVNIEIHQDGNINYSSATTSIYFEVEQAKEEQVITFQNFDNVTYGTASVPLNAYTTSGLEIIYSSTNPEVASIVDGALEIHKAGSASITASQMGDDTYYPAVDVIQDITVEPALLIFIADNKSITYGEDLPSLTYSLSGFVKGETEDVLLEKPIISTTATQSSNAGEYTIIGEGGVAENYEFQHNSATLTIQKAMPEISLDPIEDKTTEDIEVEVILTKDTDTDVTWSIEGPAIFEEAQLKIILNGQPGFVSLTATQEESINYNAASTSVSFEVIYFNYAPKELIIDNLLIDEGTPANSLIGNLSTVDDNENDSHTYTLSEGDGDNDNGKFFITDHQLFINEVADFESSSSYNIRIQTTDESGEFLETPLTINVKDINEAPVEITLSNTEVDENLDRGTVIGEFVSEDPDIDDTHAFSLVNGEGDNDNLSFFINENILETKKVFQFEDQNEFSIRVRSTDAGGLKIERVFLINVLKVTGIDLGEIKATIVYPIPATTHLFINNGSFSEAKIYDNSGRLIKTVQLTPGPEDSNIDITGIRGGVYFLHLKDNDKIEVKKIVIK